MCELFDTFDESGNKIGTALRSEVHRKGYWHRASNIFVFSADGRLLLQRRQYTKDICPGLWDLSAAEHLKPGESFEDGAIRGLKEELGISDLKLERLGTITKARLEFPKLQVKDYEYQQSFRTIYSGTIEIDPTEVLETRWVMMKELGIEILQTPELFTPWFKDSLVDLNLLDPV